MELTEILTTAILSVCGGGGIGCLLTIKYTRMQARGEARNAENEATKSVQDIYQELIADIQKDREDQKAYISTLKEDRDHLRKDRDVLRKENENMRKAAANLQSEIQKVKEEVSRQGRKLELTTPFICTKAQHCKHRIGASIHEISLNIMKKKKEKETKE